MSLCLFSGGSQTFLIADSPGVLQLHGQLFSFLLEIVDAPVPTLRIERLEGAPDCSTYPPYKRTFGPSVLTFVR